jgi:hypothetical protein
MRSAAALRTASRSTLKLCYPTARLTQRQLDEMLAQAVRNTG